MPVPLARIVKLEVAIAAVWSTEIVAILVVEPFAMDAGANVTVTPDGKASAASETAPVNELLRVMLSVVVDVAPRAIVPDVALAASVIAGVTAGVVVSPPPLHAANRPRVANDSNRRRITVLVDSARDTR